MIMSVMLITNNNGKRAANTITQQGAVIDGYVRVYSNPGGELPGVGVLITEKHNLMTDNGLDEIRTHLTTGSVQYPINITLGNGTAPATGNTAVVTFAFTHNLLFNFPKF